MEEVTTLNLVIIIIAGGLSAVCIFGFIAAIAGLIQDEQTGDDDYV